MDKKEIDRMIEQTAKTIFSYCLSRTNSKEEAEDLSQDIILEIMKSTCNIHNDKLFTASCGQLQEMFIKAGARKRVGSTVRNLMKMHLL